jgi:murein DD-endopeptidase MepM/ murein hydrolase activator NlpD
MSKCSYFSLGLVVLASIEEVSTSVKAGNRYMFPLRPMNIATFSGGGHAYPAVDIFSRTGTEFVAPIGGFIEATNRVDSWDPERPSEEDKGGLWVSLLGDDGLRYYGSHLSEVAKDSEVGRRIEIGATLGRVGRTGNARGKPSHLHFGISPSQHCLSWKVRRGEIDPIPLLQCAKSSNCLLPVGWWRGPPIDQARPGRRQ